MTDRIVHHHAADDRQTGRRLDGVDDPSEIRAARAAGPLGGRRVGDNDHGVAARIVVIPSRRQARPPSAIDVLNVTIGAIVTAPPTR